MDDTTTLQNLAIKITNFGQLSASKWRGGISVNTLLANGTVSQGSIDSVLDTIDSYFVPVNSQCETRCVDGRHSNGQSASELGPQVAGGTPGAGFPFRLSGNSSERNSSNFVDDADLTVTRALEAGYVPGGHRDTHGHGVGCGAIDKMDQAFSVLVDQDFAETIFRLTQGLLGDYFDEASYEEVLKNAYDMSENAEEYFTDRAASIEQLETKLGHSVQVLEGNHQECFVIVNTVADTTFDNDTFCDTHDGVQAFNYDFWRTLQFAAELFPSDLVAQNRFITARVMTTIATLMVLTDGSQQLVVRSS